MKYRKKPVVIEALQYNGLNSNEVKEFAGKNVEIDINDLAWQVGKGVPIITITIKTLEGDMNVSKGDFIIKGIKGEFYPCKPDIFEKTYEEVVDDGMGEGGSGMNAELERAIKVIGNTRLHTYDGIGNIQSKPISESREFKVIAKTLTELDELKRDVARYFRLQYKNQFERMTQNEIHEMYVLREKLSKVGK